MALEDKHPNWYLFLHFWGGFFGPLVIFYLGISFTLQSKSLEDTNAYLAETINSLVVANAVATKIEKAEKIIVSDLANNTKNNFLAYTDNNPLAVTALNNALIQGEAPDINAVLKKKIKASPQVLLSEYSIKIWYPKGNSKLRKKAFLYKNLLLKSGFKNDAQVYSTGGVFFNSYTPPKNSQISYKTKSSTSTDLNIPDALFKILGINFEEGTETVTDFDILLVVGTNS